MLASWDSRDDHYFRILHATISAPRYIYGRAAAYRRLIWYNISRGAATHAGHFRDFIVVRFSPHISLRRNDIDAAPWFLRQNGRPFSGIISKVLSRRAGFLASAVRYAAWATPLPARWYCESWYFRLSWESDIVYYRRLTLKVAELISFRCWRSRHARLIS